MKLKKIIAGLLILTMCLSCLVACKPKVDIDDGSGVVRPSTDTDDFRMNELTTINVGLSCDASWYSQGGYTPSNNPAYTLHKNAMNIELKNKIELPWQGYEQQITNRIITGDLPDIFFVSQPILDELIRNKRIMNLSGYYDQWATKDLKDNIEVNDKINLAYPTRGDKLYGIPAVNDEGERPTLWYRKDWIKNLNVKATSSQKKYAGEKRFNEEGPKSVDEFWDLCKAFALDDPDNNASSKTFGLEISKNLDNSILPVFNAYGAYPSIVERQADGSFINLGLDDKNKEPLKKLAEMVSLNAIDSDFKNMDYQAAISKFTSGHAGMMFGVFYTPLNGLQGTLDLNPKAEWGACPMITNDGSEFIPTRAINLGGYYVVRSGYEHPEALIKILNNIASLDAENAWQKGWAELNTLKGTDNAFNWLPIRTDRFDANFQRYTGFEYAFNHKVDGNYDLSKIKAQDLQTWKKITDYLDNGNKNMWQWWSTYFMGVETARKYEDRGKFSDWNYPNTKTMSIKQTYLADLASTTFTKIISGTNGYKDVDTAWETYKTTWTSGGGKNILREMKDYYKTIK